MPGEGDPRARLYRGLALAVVGVLVLSPDALIIRSIDESPWTIVFWRGIFIAISLTTFVALMTRGHVIGAFRAIGSIGIVVAVFQAGAGLAFVTAITQTSVANVLVIASTAPLFMALFARIFLKEPILARTWVAIGCVIAAVVVVFAGSFSTGSFVGDTIAVGCAISQAIASTAVRRARAVSMVPALVLAALMSASIGLAAGAALPGASSLGLLALYGLALAPTALALLTTAIRYLPAPEVSLITQLELVLGPLWVWAILDEVPSPHGVVGGLVILVALTIHTFMSLRSQGEDDVPSATGIDPSAAWR